MGRGLGRDDARLTRTDRATGRSPQMLEDRDRAWRRLGSHLGGGMGGVTARCDGRLGERGQASGRLDQAPTRPRRADRQHASLRDATGTGCAANHS